MANKKNVVILLVVVILITSFGWYQYHKSIVGSLNVSLQNLMQKEKNYEAEIELYKIKLNEITVEGERIEVWQQMKNDLAKHDAYRSKELVKIIRKLNDDNVGKTIDIYSGDDNYQEIETWYELPYDDSAKLKSNLEMIAIYLSEYSFGGYPIEVVNVAEVDNEKIAYIDISDPDKYDNAWVVNFFGGSTAGYITSEVLINSFLQKDNDYEVWIDAVRFTFEGENGYITDHDPSLFNAIYYRDGNIIYDE